VLYFYNSQDAIVFLTFGPLQGLIGTQLILSFQIYRLCQTAPKKNGTINNVYYPVRRASVEWHLAVRWIER